MVEKSGELKLGWNPGGYSGACWDYVEKDGTRGSLLLVEWTLFLLCNVIAH